MESVSDKQTQKNLAWCLRQQARHLCFSILGLENQVIQLVSDHTHRSDKGKQPLTRSLHSFSLQAFCTGCHGAKMWKQTLMHYCSAHPQTHFSTVPLSFRINFPAACVTQTIDIQDKCHKLQVYREEEPSSPLQELVLTQLECVWYYGLDVHRPNEVQVWAAVWQC